MYSMLVYIMSFGEGVLKFNTCLYVIHKLDARYMHVVHTLMCVTFTIQHKLDDRCA